MSYTEDGLNKLETVKKQTIEILNNDWVVTCKCGRRAHIRFFFKCLYCRQYYCYQCAEVHFGQTVGEYKAMKKERIQLLIVLKEYYEKENKTQRVK